MCTQVNVKDGDHDSQAEPRQVSVIASSWGQVASITEALLKQLTLVGILLYGLGLFVANIHYARYGFTDFSLLKPQCIFTGLWSVFFIFCAAIPSLALVLALKLTENVQSISRSLKTLVAVLAAAVFVATVASGGISFFILGPRGTKDTWTTIWGLAPPGWLTLLLVMNVPTFLFVRDLRSLPHRGRLQVVVFSLLTPVLVAAIVLGYEIYPQVTKEAGGGLPEQALFLFGKEGESTVSAIRSQVNHEQDNLATGTVAADLMFTGSDYLVLRIEYCSPEKKASELTPVVDKKLISSYFPTHVPSLPDKLNCQ